MDMKTFLSAALFGSLLAGCAVSPEKQPPVETPPPLPMTSRVYGCEGSGPVTVRFKGDTVVLQSAEGLRVLRRAVTVSGVRYADSAASFWMQGGNASWEFTGRPARICRVDSGATAWEQAWERGVNVRATGAEVAEKGRVDWTLEVTAGKEVVFTSGKARRTVRFVDTIPYSDASSQRVYGSWRSRTLIVEWDRRPCRAGSQGEPLDLAVKVEYGGKKYLGCGRALDRQATGSL
jgi:membrane-bound inhibitor of C-type lysozyme